jgi:hypothetical protein
VSAINSILYKLGNKPEVKPRRLGYLKRKLELLTDLKVTKLADDTLAEIMKLDPANIDLKPVFIRKAFDNEATLWQGYTEYLRYQACVQYQILMNPQDKEGNDKLRAEIEQFKYLLQVKLPKLT